MLDRAAALARDEAINEALYDAVCDGDGRPRADALSHHLAKHGFVIVEASKWDAAKTTLQVIGSTPLCEDDISPLVDAVRAARIVSATIGSDL